MIEEGSLQATKDTLITQKTPRIFLKLCAKIQGQRPDIFFIIMQVLNKILSYPVRAESMV